jgi:hypothetical protein
MSGEIRVLTVPEIQSSGLIMAVHSVESIK